MAILQEISELLQKGSAKKVKALVEQALEEGVAAQDILDNGLLAGTLLAKNLRTTKYTFPKFYFLPVL